MGSAPSAPTATYSFGFTGAERHGKTSLFLEPFCSTFCIIPIMEVTSQYLQVTVEHFLFLIDNHNFRLSSRTVPTGVLKMSIFSPQKEFSSRFHNRNYSPRISSPNHNHDHYSIPQLSENRSADVLEYIAVTAGASSIWA
jgi:hypothetical protein